MTKMVAYRSPCLTEVLTSKQIRASFHGLYASSPTPCPNCCFSQHGKVPSSRKNAVCYDLKMNPITPQSFPRISLMDLSRCSNVLNHLFFLNSWGDVTQTILHCKFSAYLHSQRKEFISYKPFCLVSEISQGTRRTICVALLAGCLSTEQSYDRGHSDTILQIYMFDYSSLTHLEHILCNYIRRNPNCSGLLHGTRLLTATIVPSRYWAFHSTKQNVVPILHLTRSLPFWY